MKTLLHFLLLLGLLLAVLPTAFAQNQMLHNNPGNSMTDYVQVGNMGAWPANGSVAFAMKASVVQNYRNMFSTACLSGCNNGLRIEQCCGPNEFGMLIGNDGGAFGGMLIMPSPTFLDNTWYHVAVTWDVATGLVLSYINGSLANSYTSSTFPSQFHNVTLGGGFDPSRLFAGYLENVTVWTKTLTLAEVQTLAAGTVTASDPDLKGYWNFDGITTDGNNVTVPNMATNYAGQFDGTTVGTASTPVFLASTYTPPPPPPPPAHRHSVADGNWNTPATWDCNCVPTLTDTVTMNNSITVTANITRSAPTLGTGLLTLNANAVFTANQNISIGSMAIVQGTFAGSGDLTLSGNLQLGGQPNVYPSSSGFLFNTGNTTVDGTLQWNRDSEIGNGTGAGTVTVTGLTTLTNDAGFTISKPLRNKTLICNGGMDITTLYNNAPNNLYLHNGAVLRIPVGATLSCAIPDEIIGDQTGNSVFENFGTIHTTAGTLVIHPDMSNVGAIWVENSSIDLRGSGTHTGMFTLANGNLNFGRGTHNLNAATVTGTGTSSLSANFTCCNPGNLSATVNLNAGTTVSPGLNFSMNFTSIVNDNVGVSFHNFDSFGGNYNATQPVIVTGNMVLNKDQNSNNGFFSGNANLTVVGTLTMNSKLQNSGTNTIGTLVLNSGEISGTNTLNITANCTLNGSGFAFGLLNTGNITIGGDLTSNGSLQIANIGNMSIGGNFNLNEGYVGGYLLNRTSTITIGGDLNMLNFGNHYFTAKTVVCNGNVNESVGNLYLENNASITLNAGGTWTNSGSGNYFDASAGPVFGGTITINGTYLNTFAGGVSMNVGIAVVNNGTIKTNGGNISITGPLTNNPSGILAGVNNISITNATFTNNGHISPGLSIGTLGITRSSLPVKILDIEIAAGSPVQKDLLNVTGHLVLTGATLNVTETQCLANGEYDIISYTGNRTGTFTTLNLPPGYTVRYVNAAQKVRLVYADPVPSITCPAPIITDNTPTLCAKTGLALGAANATDNCPGVSSSNNAPTSYPVGITTVIWTATDSKAQTATCAQTVTINDVESPTITCPANVTLNTGIGNCGAAYPFQIGTATATDNCGTVTITDNTSTLPVGINTVIWTATDAASNQSTCTQTVTVVDNQVPFIACPADVTANNDPNTCAAALSIATATISDNCVVTTAHNAPPTFSVGITTVIHTATDASGNTAMCAQTVTVIDNQLPTITCVNISRSASANLCTWPASGLGPATTGDNCGVASTTNNIPALIPVGVNVYVYTVTDVHGNTATCNRTITVNDTQNPVITCPSNVTANADAGQCSAANLGIGTATATDNCSVASIINDAPGSGIFSVGNTNVKWTATDASNRKHTCTQIVTVVDNQTPSITTCPSAKILNANAGLCSSSTGPGLATAMDNCSATVAHNAVLPFPVGITIVTHTATDGGGNTATCTQTITVNDNQLPTITCPAAASATTAVGSCTAPVSLGMATAADNCSIGSINNDAPPVFPAGNSIVIWTATDASGNTRTCTQTVTVTANAANEEICTNNIDDDCDGATDEPLDIMLTYPNTQPACNGGLGTVRVNPPSPVTDYGYLWSTGAATRTVPSVPAGTYTVTVTRTETGCSIVGTNVLAQPTPFNISMAIVNVKCNGTSTGSAIATVTGSNIGKTYLWSTGSDSNKIENLAAGIYTFTVTDIKVCTASTSVTITEPTPLLLSHTIVPVAGNKYKVTLTGSGGTPYSAPHPYRYCRLVGTTCTYVPARNYTGLLPNTMYEFKVRDGNLCVKSIMVTTPNTMSVPDVFERDLNVEQSMLEIYPNPASDELHIGFVEMPHPTGMLTIMDVFGKKILEQQVSENDLTEGVLNMRLDGKFADGLYLLQFRSGGGTVLTGKFEVVRR